MSPTASRAPPSTADSITLQIDKLCFGYPQRTLFDNLSLTIGTGVTLLRGDDGSGKTTLLRLLSGDLQANSGDLSIHGVALHDQHTRYQSQVFWIDVRTPAYDQVTAEEYWRGVQAKHAAFDPQALPDLIVGLSLAEHAHKPLTMLSTGSRRKVWLAAAFAANAPVTLLDDPFAALDKPSIQYVLALLRDAATRLQRSIVIADYTAPPGVPLSAVIELPG